MVLFEDFLSSLVCRLDDPSSCVGARRVKRNPRAHIRKPIHPAKKQRCFCHAAVVSQLLFPHAYTSSPNCNHARLRGVINAKTTSDHAISHQMSSAATPLGGVPLPTALRRLLAASDGRALQQQGACLFSTNSRSAVPSQSPSSEEEEEETLAGGGAALEGSSATSSSSSVSSYTVVKHPSTPGWEFPPVPAGCEPSFAVIRLGNTQHKVCLYCVYLRHVRRGRTARAVFRPKLCT